MDEAKNDAINSNLNNKTENKNHCREWLIRARIKKNLTQEELGKKVGVTSNCITQYEKNVRFPKPQILVKLCEVLEIDIKKFYEDQ